MKPIAIHNNGSWASLWVSHCIENAIPHRIVSCYDSDILDQVHDCSALMWPINQAYPEDMLMARHVLTAAEKMGLKIWPDFHTNWHFDDKLAQKYLFEATEVPAIPSWAFFDKEKATDFVNSCELPIVAKLRRGAGSYNVRLLKTRSQARRYVKRMFGRGYSPAPLYLADAKNKLKVAASSGGLHGIISRLKKAPGFFRCVAKGRKYFSNEKGYVYFQQFASGNTCDIRISVIGDRAWAFRRLVRENDFRASGSGMIDYDTKRIPSSLVEMSFNAAAKLQMQSVCFDWVRVSNDKYLFVEVSYGFVDSAVYACPGFWDRSLRWHDGHYHPAVCAFEDFVNTLSCSLKQSGVYFSPSYES